MSISVEFHPSPGLTRLLGTNADTFIEGIVKESAEQTNTTIKMPGFSPTDKNKLRDNHRVTGSGTERSIVNNTPYLKWILSGHRVLTTPRSKRWWFWYLNTVLGGGYTRKTNGARGYVAPNNYPRRAMIHMTAGGHFKQIQTKWLKMFIGGK